MNNKELLETLSNMSVLDLCELTRELENKWGMVGISQRTGYSGFPQAFTPIGTPIIYYEWVQSEFSVVLKSFPSNKKVPILKIIREVTGLPLAEAKAIIENLPQAIKESIPNTEANELTLRLREIGAEVIIE